ncbi:MAG: hypothetical protein HKN23_16975 [Verrucomicrobiales bacterium]|nr:hypothetical protein [Verrucomicrobiales bacterium]
MASEHDVIQDRLIRMFQHLAESEQWDRLLELGPQILAQDPENFYVHATLAQAALQTDDDLNRARLHAKAALASEPEEPFAHLVTARVHRKANRMLDAKRSLLDALKFDPEDSGLWHEFGWNCYERGDYITAREAVKQARSLAPNDASIENLATVVASVAPDQDRLDAFDQIEALEETLRLDPENESVMHNIGQVYLQELDDAKNAEEWFRRAAAIDPTSRMIQKGLIAAIRRRDPVLRVLNFPKHLGLRVFRTGQRWIAKKMWLILVLLPLLPFVAALLMVAATFWAVFLAAPAKLYEWLTITEVLKKAGGVTGYRRGIHRLPFWVRFFGFLAIFPLFLWAVWWFCTAPEAKVYHDALIGGSMILGFAIGIWWSAKRQNKRD